MENIDPSAINRPFFQHFSAAAAAAPHHHHQHSLSSHSPGPVFNSSFSNGNGYQHHPHHPHVHHPHHHHLFHHQHHGFPVVNAQGSPMAAACAGTAGGSSGMFSGSNGYASSHHATTHACSFAGATSCSSTLAVSTENAGCSILSSPASSSTTAAAVYPTPNSLLYSSRSDSYSESSSPNLNGSAGSTTGFAGEHVAPYTPSPSESDSLDQTDSIGSCDASGMTSVDLEDEDDDECRGRRSRHRRRRHGTSSGRGSHGGGSPMVQRQAANLRERRRMQSINEAFEVSEANDRLSKSSCIPSLTRS